MGLRRMLILLGIGLVAVVGLGLYVVLVELPGDRGQQPGGQALVLADDAEAMPTAVTKLALRRGEQELVIERTGDEAWRLRRPVDARADRSAVLALLTDLKNLRVESTVPARDLDDFGLRQPRLALTLSLGDRERRLAIGDETPGAKAQEKKVYLRLDDGDDVLVADAAMLGKLTAPVVAFRDRRVFPHLRKPAQAQAVRILSGAPKLVLERREAGWQLTEPVADYADAAKVHALLLHAATLRVAHFVTEDAARLADYGLDEPAATCEIVTTDGTTMTLLIATPGDAGEGLVYAKRGEEPTIFTLKQLRVSHLTVTPEDVRSRMVVELTEGDVTAITIERGDGTYIVARDAGDQPWRLVEPSQAEASQEAVAGFLDALQRLRADRWIDDPWSTAHEFFRKPDAVITVSRGTDAATMKPPVKLLVSRRFHTNVLDGRFIQRQGQRCLLYVSSQVSDAASPGARESAQAAQALTGSLKGGRLHFLSRRVFRFDPSHATQLQIEREDVLLVCERTDDGWRLTLPVAMDADGLNVAGITAAMANLRAQDYVAEEPKELLQYGLLDPALTLSVTVAPPGKKPFTRTLLVGTPVEGAVHGMARGGKHVFTLTSWDVKALSTEPIDTSLGDWAEEDVVGLTVERRGEHPIVAERVAGGWQLTWPTQARVNRLTAKQAVGVLHDFQIPRYLDYEAKAPPAYYGLERPELTISVKLREGDDVVVSVGKPIEDDARRQGFYATVRGRAPVFLMPRETVEAVAKVFDELVRQARAR